MASDAEIHKWAQEALDKFNSSYGASNVNKAAVGYLYQIRSNGNNDANLANASRYLHCRYISSTMYIPGAIIGTIAALGYDGAIKYIDTLVKKHWDKELIHKFGEAKTSDFNPKMLP